MKTRDCSPEAAAEAFELLEGRWKLIIIHNLFGRKGARSPVMRFSELERAIPNVSQKMLIQQLRYLERNGIVQRTIHPQVPPKVEYQLTSIGEALRPTLRALLDWAALRNQKRVYRQLQIADEKPANQGKSPYRCRLERPQTGKPDLEPDLQTGQEQYSKNPQQACVRSGYARFCLAFCSGTQQSRRPGLASIQSRNDRAGSAGNRVRFLPSSRDQAQLRPKSSQPRANAVHVQIPACTHSPSPGRDRKALSKSATWKTY